MYTNSIDNIYKKEVVTMTRKYIGFLLMFSLFMFMLAGCSTPVGTGEDLEPTIRISGAWALYPMMLVWSDEYMKTHDIHIEVSGGGAGKGISDVLNDQVDIGMVSRPIKDAELEQGAFYIAVAKDTVLAIINEKNPVYRDILEKGLSKEELRKIFMREVTHWGELFNKEIADDMITVYGRADASGAASVWANFLGGYTEADLQNKSDSNVSGDQAIAGSVQGDVNAISFSNMNYVYDAVTGGYAQSIRPVPVDLNDDDRLGGQESFYENRGDFLKGVSEGIYPSPPTREEYLVGNGPFRGEVKELIHWILEQGQDLLEPNGYVKLLDDERANEKSFLENGKRE